MVVFKNFANFTGKLQSPNLFDDVAGSQSCQFIKKRLQHRGFPVKFATFLRTHFFTEHFLWLFLTVLGF